MGERLRRRTIYLATVAAMIAMTGGFVMATTITTLTSPPPQGGSYAATGAPPAGVSTSAILILQASATSPVSTSSAGVPAILTATTATTTDFYYLNAVANVGDFLQKINLTITAGSPAPTANLEYQVQVFINGVTASPITLWVETSATFAAPGVQIVSVVYDLGAGSSPVTITAVSDLVTQCTSVGSC